MTAPGRSVASVLLPCRDAAETLEEALRSLAAQTYGEMEIVAVDDGSTDATAEVLRGWTVRLTGLRVLRISRRGLVEALRVAAAEARGEILVRMDADDVAHPERVARQIAWLDRHPEAAACGTLIRYFPRRALRDGARRYERWINAAVRPEEIERELFVECPIPHPTLALRRPAFEAVGGYRDRGWPEDYDLVLRLVQAGYRIGKVPAPLLQWRERPDRLSRTAPQYAPDAFRRCKAHFLGPLRIRDRPVVLWGAGPVGKAFARTLREAGHDVVAFVDLDPRKVGQIIHGGAPVIPPDDIDGFRGAYVLAAVGQRGARDEIRAALGARGWTDVEEFCAVA